MAQLPPKRTKRPSLLKGAPQKSLKAKLRSASKHPISVRKKATPLIALQMEAASKKDIEAEIIQLHNCFQATCRQSRDVARQLISKACAVAACLKRNESAWRAFCEDEIWDAGKTKPNPAKPDQALRYVLLRITGLKAAKLASKWYKAVQPLVAQGVDPTDIPAAIGDAGGIEKLARAHAKRKKSIPTQGGLTKNPARAAAKMAKGEEVQHGLAGKPRSVNLHASLEKNGENVLGLPMDAYANLTIQLRGREGPALEIAILEARQIEPPE